ncbi:MAG TPA: vanadium-dependent haloperoxidase [Ilumatobacter sp.]|jgi:hypothetical protein|nr:vanadium-dependent haloperoxidase [Ilumatobacter sp.]
MSTHISGAVRRHRLAAAVLASAIVVSGLGWVASAPVASAASNAVIDWNAVAGQAARDACLSPDNDPLHEARMYAIAHIAIHDALNAIDRRYEPYTYDVQAPAGSSEAAAVAAAARSALVAVLLDLPSELFPPACGAAGIATVEAAYTAALAAIPDGLAKSQGVAVGEAAATAIVALRSNDHANDAPLVDVDYPQGTEPGEYKFTPGFGFAFAPKWGSVTPFALADSSQFASGPPYPLSSKRYAEDFNEVKAFGALEDSERSAEQTQIAKFWVESSPLAWNRMARTIAVGRGLDMWESARLFGLLNMGMTDGYIGTFQEKYVYNFWRPVTAIRAAATDGNGDTDADPDWLPLMPTPPIPDHDSGHSVEGGVAATIMRQVFGTDKVTFAVCSFSLGAGERCDAASPVMRHFTRISDAADENGESRILVGFHFRHAVVDGIAHGKHIGNWTVGHYMQPVDG